MIYTLDYLKQEADRIQASWDGTDAGIAEDRAHAAKELEEKIKEIEAIIEELDI